MKETIRIIEQSENKCLDIDAHDNLDFLTITETGEIISTTFEIRVDIDVQFPIIRRLDYDKFLLVDARTSRGRNNAWIIENQGRIVKDFMVGDGIEDILVQQGKIVITYFDEGVLSGIKPSDQGLVVFNFEGRILFKYLDNYGQFVDVTDCYCICPKGNNSVLFSLYTDYPLIELNLETFDQIIHKPPKKLNGSASIANRGADVFFHSPYQDKRGIYRWTIGSDQAMRIGEYSPRLRGLKGGKFLKCGERGYTIIDPTERSVGQ